MENANWRTKLLPLAEWSVLQEHFGKLIMLAGAPANMAMFLKDQAGDPEAAIYMTGPGIAAIEALSPGGWTDSAAPSGQGVKLLVAEGDPWTYFGIEKPA